MVSKRLKENSSCPYPGLLLGIANQKGTKTMCDNQVSYYIPKGYDYREVFVKCGNTDYHGERAICDTCSQDPQTMQHIKNQEANIAADNAWAKSAGWGEY
jgi:hypothetical protein